MKLLICLAALLAYGSAGEVRDKRGIYGEAYAAHALPLAAAPVVRSYVAPLPAPVYKTVAAPLPVLRSYSSYADPHVVSPYLGHAYSSPIVAPAPLVHSAPLLYGAHAPIYAKSYAADPWAGW